MCSAPQLRLARGTQTFTTLLSFDGSDGAAPFGALIQGTDGNLFGTTAIGGLGCQYFSKCGTAFDITPRGKVTTLYTFVNGDNPEAGLVQAADGSLFGTTFLGYNPGIDREWRPDSTAFALKLTAPMANIREQDLRKDPTETCTGQQTQGELALLLNVFL